MQRTWAASGSDLLSLLRLPALGPAFHLSWSPEFHRQHRNKEIRNRNWRLVKNRKEIFLTSPGPAMPPENDISQTQPQVRAPEASVVLGEQGLHP